MKRILLLLILAVSALSADAQFYGYRRDSRPREEQTAPKFKDGDEGVERFMKKNFRNPTPIDRNVSGDVVVDVVISEKGRVEECRVVRGVEARYDKEAVRVAEKMKFKPAKVGKRKVKARHRFSFPIRRGRLSFMTLNTVDV